MAPMMHDAGIYVMWHIYSSAAKILNGDHIGTASNLNICCLRRILICFFFFSAAVAAVVAQFSRGPLGIPNVAGVGTGSVGNRVQMAGDYYS